MRKHALAAVICLFLTAPALGGCGAPPNADVAAQESETPPGVIVSAPARAARDTLDQAAALFGPAVAQAAPREGERVLSTALVELLPDEPRTPRQGGSAAALLADPMSAVNVAKNLAVCRALFAAFDQTTSETSPPDGPVASARPIYWLARGAARDGEAADRCLARLSAYDYERGAQLRALLGLVSPGPFLVLERADPDQFGRVAVVLDLARVRPDQIAAQIDHFRSEVLQAENSWAPSLYRRAPTPPPPGETLTGAASARLMRASRDPGCVVERFLDRCGTPG